MKTLGVTHILGKNDLIFEPYTYEIGILLSGVDSFKYLRVYINRRCKKCTHDNIKFMINYE